MLSIFHFGLLNSGLININTGHGKDFVTLGQKNKPGVLKPGLFVRHFLPDFVLVLMR